MGIMAIISNIESGDHLKSSEHEKRGKNHMENQMENTMPENTMPENTLFMFLFFFAGINYPPVMVGLWDWVAHSLEDGPDGAPRSSSSDPTIM